MLLKEAYLTLSLKKENHFISAYNSKIVFGKVNKENCYCYYFEFFSFELEILYQGIRNMLNFLVDENLEEHPISIFKKSQDIKYQWIGKIFKLNNGKSIKLVEIVIINHENLSEPICLDEEYLATLLIALSHVFFSSMLLNTSEKFFLHLLSNETEENLLLMKSIENNFLNNFIKKFMLTFPNMKEQHFELYQLFMFYFEQIKIISQIKNLIQRM